MPFQGEQHPLAVAPPCYGQGQGGEQDIVGAAVEEVGQCGEHGLGEIRRDNGPPPSHGGHRVDRGVRTGRAVRPVGCGQYPSPDRQLTDPLARLLGLSFGPAPERGTDRCENPGVGGAHRGCQVG